MSSNKLTVISYRFPRLLFSLFLSLPIPLGLMILIIISQMSPLAIILINLLISLTLVPVMFMSAYFLICNYFPINRVKITEFHIRYNQPNERNIRNAITLS